MQDTGYKRQDTGCKMQDAGEEMQSYEDLEIYKLAHKLAIEIHKMTLKNLPKFEMYEEGSQIRRSSKSISATIVEGFGRKQYQQEFIRYITYAIASCDETKEHLELLFETGSLKKEDMFKYLLEGYKELGKKLYRFREAIRNNLNPES